MNESDLHLFNEDELRAVMHLLAMHVKPGHEKVFWKAVVAQKKAEGFVLEVECSRMIDELFEDSP